MTNLSNVLFWKREYWAQCERYESAGHWGNDLVHELTLRDAEYARFQAYALYRAKVLELWRDRQAARETLSRKVRAA